MGKVVKKGGKKQSFLPRKIRISVERAAKEAKLAPKKVREVLEEVAEPVIALYKKKKLVKATELRRSLLGRLDRKAKKVSAAWRRYDRKKK